MSFLTNSNWIEFVPGMTDEVEFWKAEMKVENIWIDDWCAFLYILLFVCCGGWTKCLFKKKIYYKFQVILIVVGTATLHI